MTQPSGSHSVAFDGSGARRAALLMHALAAPDRAWLLGQLNDDQREQLQALLAEVGALGIERIASAVPDLLRVCKPESHDSEAQPALHLPAGAPDIGELPTATLAARLALLTPMRLGELLRDEPETLALRVLAHCDHRARAKVRHELGAVSADGIVPPPSESRMDRAVLMAVLRRDERLPTRSAVADGLAAWLPAALRRPSHRRFGSRGRR